MGENLDARREGPTYERKERKKVVQPPTSAYSLLVCWEFQTQTAPRFGPDLPRVRTQRFGWLHDLRLATTELQPVTRLLDLAVASTKSSSLAPVVGAVVPLMASKKGGLNR